MCENVRMSKGHANVHIVEGGGRYPGDEDPQKLVSDSLRLFVLILLDMHRERP